MSAQRVKPASLLGGVVGLVGLSVLAGVLVTAMVTPALAVTSTTANNSISLFENLPAFIAIGEQSQQNQIYAQQGGKPVLIATVYKQNRQEVTWDEVSPFLRDGAVAGEDRRFYEHGGVDLNSIARAFIKNSTTDTTSGSSTLDMQLVKNILTNEALNAPTEKEQKAQYYEATKASYDRKLKEMKLAIGLDKRYTKKQILLGYLNIVGMGGTTYGVESAAQRYFSVSAKDVTLAQAASLIAIVQQPNLQNLSDPKLYPANKVRRDQILNAMLELKYITQAQHDEAINTPIAAEVKLSAPKNGCRNTVPIGAAWACDYVTKLITSPTKPVADTTPQVLSLGTTVADRTAAWDKGGYKIYTSIDLDLQKVADDSLAQQAPASEARFPLGAAADTVEIGTGRVLVMANNKTFDDAGAVEGVAQDVTKTAVNYSTDFAYGGSVGFTTGSTFKVIDLANWLSTGHGLNDLVDGTGPQNYSNSSFKCDGVALGAQPFKLQNDGNSRGSYMTVKAALMASVNNAFMHMAEKQDLCDIRDTAVSMGAHRADGKPLETIPNFILGSNEQAPLTMAGVAATIGGGGLHCQARIIDSITGPDGKKLDGQAQTCNQALTPDVAAGAANAMVGSMISGTSANGNPRDGTPIGGKTGTSGDAEQVWIMGTTTKVATAVWTGNVSGHTSLRKNINPVTKLQYAAYSRFNVMKAVMKTVDAMPQYKGAAFPVASATVLGGSSSVIPVVAGQTVDQATSLLTSLQFTVSDGGPEASGLPAGRVTRTNPAAGSKVPDGASITIYESDGSLATTMPSIASNGTLLHDALTAISSAGFSTSNVSISFVPGQLTGAQKACIVQGSDPAPGAAAAKTDPISLTVYGDPLGKDPGCQH